MIRHCGNSGCMLVSSVKVFSKNVEVKHMLTYHVVEPPYRDRNNSLSFELNQSFVLLPEDPMIPRPYDPRVGFFAVKQTDYGFHQNTIQRKYITRWRPEPSDWLAFMNGEMVEPVKPIVYYPDPATPKKWRPYIKKGVEDW